VSANIKMADLKLNKTAAETYRAFGEQALS